MLELPREECFELLAANEGVTAEVDRHFDVSRLNLHGLKPWAPGPKPHWSHIHAWTVSARRIVASDELTDSSVGAAP